jgi:uncharacterized NAD-dependent epimerase/dehydratase family protein
MLDRSEYGDRLAILAHDQFPDRAKTAVGVLRYGDYEVVAVLDRALAGDRVRDHVPDLQDAPIVSSFDAIDEDVDALAIGIAPDGGGFDESWRDDVRAALETGCDVIAGLHYPLAEDDEFTAPAADHGGTLHDVREPPDDLSLSRGQAASVDADVVATVGTDGSVGKMTTSLKLVDAARERGVDAAMIPTGQTGIIIEDWGIPIDRTVSDFTAGAVERMCRERADHDYLFVEGQGSVVHPAYSAVTTGILHGAMPDSLVLCHEAGRTAIHGYESFAIPDPGEVASLYESLAEPVAPTEVVAGALNTKGLSERDAGDALARYRSQLGVPVADPIREGPEALLEAVL